LGAKIALHLGVYHGSVFGKLVSDAGSAGGANSSTAVIDAVDVGMPVVQRLQKLNTLLEKPSNAATVCQWVLVRLCPFVRLVLSGIARGQLKKSK